MLNDESIHNPFVGPGADNVFKPVMNSRYALRVALSSPSLASQDFQKRLSESTIFKPKDDKEDSGKGNAEADADKTSTDNLDWLESATDKLFNSHDQEISSVETTTTTSSTTRTDIPAVAEVELKRGQSVRQTIKEKSKMISKFLKSSKKGDSSSHSSQSPKNRDKVVPTLSVQEQPEKIIPSTTRPQSLAKRNTSAVPTHVSPFSFSTGTTSNDGNSNNNTASLRTVNTIAAVEYPEKEVKLNIRKQISCKLFDNGKGVCVYGSSCHYSHEKMDNDSENDPSNNYNSHTSLSRKTSAGVGSPDHGKIVATATFSNSSALVRRRSTLTQNETPCTFFNYGKGHCEYGIKCRFSHSILPAMNHGSSVSNINTSMSNNGSVLLKMRNKKIYGHRRGKSEQITSSSDGGNGASSGSGSGLGGVPSRKASLSRKVSLTSHRGSRLKLSQNISSDDLSSSSVQANNPKESATGGNIYSILSEDGIKPILYRSPSSNNNKSGNTFKTPPHRHSQNFTLTRSDSTVNNAKRPCKNFNFGKGQCPFGIHCHFLHIKEDGTPVEEEYDPLQHIQVDETMAMMFTNPYGQGDICAAAVIPYIRVNDKVWAMILIEDKFDRSCHEWKPALSMFSGKVSHKDPNWLTTAARKFSSQLNGRFGSVNEAYFVDHYNETEDINDEHNNCNEKEDIKKNTKDGSMENIPSKMAGFGQYDESVQRQANLYSAYLNQSKLQVLYYPLSMDQVSSIAEDESKKEMLLSQSNNSDDHCINLFEYKKEKASSSNSSEGNNNDNNYVHKILFISVVEDEETGSGFKVHPDCWNSETSDLPLFCDNVFESALQNATFPQV